MAGRRAIRGLEREFSTILGVSSSPEIQYGVLNPSIKPYQSHPSNYAKKFLAIASFACGGYPILSTSRVKI